MSDWIRDGERVTGLYMGTQVTGIVESSRVKYGGEVQYTVNLDVPVQLRWRADPTNRVLLNRSEIQPI